MIFEIISSAAPGVLAAMGALISELAGVMAVFLEGIITLGAFLCFSFSVFTGNIYVGSAISIALCVAFLYVIALFIERYGANPFLTGLAVNLFVGAFVSVLSSVWFGTRGTITHDFFDSRSFFARGGITLLAWLTVAVLAAGLQKTRWGLRLKITGSDPDVLEARGIRAKKYRVLSWCAAAALAAAAGCILMIRLQSFVPNISSGRGWTALAAVFLGRKKTYGVIASALFFAAAEHTANYLQGTAVIPPAVLLAFPYVVALALFVLLPAKKENGR